MTLHLTCAFEVIILPNESVIALFHHFFIQFEHIAEIGQNGHNTTTSRLPAPCISQILRTFNSPMAKGVDATPPPPPNRFFKFFSRMGRAFFAN